MTKAELEKMIEERNIMSMAECKQELYLLGKPMSAKEIIQIATVDEAEKIKTLVGDDFAYDIEETCTVLKNFSAATAARQKEELRGGKRVWGPHPIDLKKNIKTYYPQIEVAAVMYLQSNAIEPFMKPSLSRILETRHG